MYRISGFVAAPGLEGGAFLVHRVDNESVVEWLTAECNKGTVVLTEIARERQVRSARVYTWYFVARDHDVDEVSQEAFCTHDGMVDDLRTWLIESGLLGDPEGPGDVLGKLEDTLCRLGTAQSGSRVNAIHEFGGGGTFGWVRRELIG